MWFTYHNAAVELLAAFALHLAIGTAPWLKKIHPARLFVWLEKFLEGVLREKMGFELKRAGGVLTIACMLVALVAGLLLARLGWPVRVFLMSCAFSCGKLFRWPRRTLRALLVHDLTRAREVMAQYVNVDTDRLTEREAAALTVTSMGHSLGDSCIAPLFWIFIGAILHAAVPFALMWTCLDVMDARIGQRINAYTDIGFFTAKASDVLGFVPAWLAGWAVVVAAAALRLSSRRAVRVMDRDHAAHTSPNGGWAVAALAGALGIQLGGDVRVGGVVMHRRLIGENTKLTEPEDISRAIRILRVAVGGALALSALVLALCGL